MALCPLWTLRVPCVPRWHVRWLSTRVRSAVQSRRHLEFAGEDGASVFTRAREAQDQRAQQAMQSATDYLMPQQAHEVREAHTQAKLRGSVRGRDALVESNIKRARDAGLFESLEGTGKPLVPREENVYEAMSGMSVAHRILKNAGCAPAWVEQSKRIREEVREARLRLEDAYLEHMHGSAFVHAAEAAADGGETEACPHAARWAAAVNAFAAELADVNKQIRTFNLIAPGSWQHLTPLKLERELARAIRDFEDAQESEREESRARRRRRQAAAGLRAAEHRRPSSPFAFGAGFALADVEFHGMFDALAAVLLPSAVKRK